MADNIKYKYLYREKQGRFDYLTPCPKGEPCMVASAACCHCKYFGAIYVLEDVVKCWKSQEDVSEGSGGFSELRPCKLSTPKGKPIQTQIQFK